MNNHIPSCITITWEFNVCDKTDLAEYTSAMMYNKSWTLKYPANSILKLYPDTSTVTNVVEISFRWQGNHISFGGIAPWS